MKHATWCAGLLCLTGLAASFTQAGGVKSKFDGVWVPQSVTRNGKEVPKDTIKSIKLIVKGTKFTIKTADKEFSGMFKLDESKTPVQIDVTSKTVEGKDHKSVGIVKLEGDTLTVCSSQDAKKRPTEFTSPEGAAGAGIELVVYRREKK
jgi:uncharacterized protein (TIGR03067 family)